MPPEPLLSEMKINILFNFSDGPAGGGNQFLRSLREYFRLINIYQEDCGSADVMLFNSHHCIDKAAELKSKNHDMVFIHRVDGPMSVYNKANDKRDKLVFAANNFIADATVFQSEWSKRENQKLGLKNKEHDTVITNAPDPLIFNREGKVPFNTHRRIRLIATSWSSNWKKGFKDYKWLDENLDFSQYEMVFVGNSPIAFNNIKHIQPLSSAQLASELKKSDIFLTASQYESCSNSLIEAMHCGLPSVGLNSGGNPAIVDKAGEIFNNIREVPGLLRKISLNYTEYQSNIANPTIDEIGKQYYDFISFVFHDCNSKPQRSKNSVQDYLIFRISLSYHRLATRIGGLF